MTEPHAESGIRVTDVVVVSGHRHQRKRKVVDDHEHVIAARLEVYARDTAPLLDYYRTRGLLAEIDGRGKHDDVLAALLAHLDVPITSHAVPAT